MTPQRDIIRIYYYKNKILHNVYYSEADNEFLIPLIETAKSMELRPREWKTDHNNARYVIFYHPILKEYVCIYELEWLQNIKETMKGNIAIDSWLFDGGEDIPEVDAYNETDVINFLCKQYNLEYIIEPPQEINKLEHDHTEPNDNNDDEPIPKVNEDSEFNNDIVPIFDINYEESNWAEIIRELNRIRFLEVNPDPEHINEPEPNPDE
jgi:hypothetical protein